ncbi:DUF1295 domain-containing protein [Marinilongibacter aquaticus]|uniref:methyltransferase family protein n=1 Tax=Marinilongibacter aquaticus TaxID=2975157 RepID=UPI0021BD0B5D|nr:DUF1295 domain-containing protein [Marinilongibacter aquaticus]UBM59719.1 DUF1295 domain-containing protein [Marinilongibacter aquaticus]
MELYGKYSRSLAQKAVIHILEIVFLILSYWILFQEGGDWFAKILSIENASDVLLRRQLIFVFNLIVFVRLGYMMFFLLKRKIPWEESISVPLAFALYYIGFSLFVLPVSQKIDTLDFFAIFLFLCGSILNSGGEILRNQWKKRPENKGKIYTEGFFKYARHINYFGDLLWVIAYALITRNPWSVTIPLFLFCFFAFFNAPQLDAYLKEKYGAAYEDYAKKTKMLIPFIY